MPTTPPAPSFARTLFQAAQDKVDLLRSIQPYFIDLSLRENPFGSHLGQTLDEKKAILPLVRQFGFTNILLGTLDYAMPEEHEVDDDFMQYLRDSGTDMTGGFAFTDIGLVPTEGFNPSASMIKMRDYGVPNTLHEIYLSKEGMKGQYDFGQLRRSIPVSVQWLLDNCIGDHGGKPRIIINIVDGCDAFAENLDQTCEILQLLATLPIEGVSFEDDRGTYMPFQVGAYTAIARGLLPAPLKLLVHMHSGAGFENASVIEALLNGADGVWGGLPKRAAIIGHASLGELIANLVRVGNPHVAATYDIANLLPLATSFQMTDEEQPLAEDLPILGANAYRLTLEFFRQLPDRFMDLPPETIGGSYGYRVAPVAANQAVAAGRLGEVYGIPAAWFTATVPLVLDQMVRLMRQELRAGTRIVYDDPTQLIALYQRAGGPTPPSAT